MSLCHLYINSPDHAFDKALKIEAEKVAGERTRGGFPVRAVIRYARGDEAVQLQQIESDLRSPEPPDLFVIIPVNQDAVYRIVKEIVTTRGEGTCVFLQQPLSSMLHSERKAYPRQLFSVSADQVEIGRIQARQFARLLPNGGSVLYLKGREHSYATRHRAKGLMEELVHVPNVKLNGYRVFGDWSPAGVMPAVEAWRKLGGRLEWIEAAGAQSDDMAIALSELVRREGRPLPVIGVDGLEVGRRAVDDGLLKATVLQPLGIGHALELFARLCSGEAHEQLIPADGNVLLAPESYPPLDALAR